MQDFIAIKEGHRRSVQSLYMENLPEQNHGVSGRGPFSSGEACNALPSINVTVPPPGSPGSLGSLSDSTVMATPSAAVASTPINTMPYQTQPSMAATSVALSLGMGQIPQVVPQVPQMPQAPLGSVAYPPPLVSSQIQNIPGISGLNNPTTLPGQVGIAGIAGLHQNLERMSIADAGIQQSLSHGAAGVQLPGATSGLHLNACQDPLPGFVGVPPPTASVAQSNLRTLTQAAVAAKQVATQKQLESQAAASAYRSAAVQSIQATDPSQQAVASVMAQQAAALYQQATNEANVALARASQLEQAAASVTTTLSVAAAAAPTNPSLVTIPASAGLAAQIASTGAFLGQLNSNLTTTSLAVTLPEVQQSIGPAAVLPSGLSLSGNSGEAYGEALPIPSPQMGIPSNPYNDPQVTTNSMGTLQPTPSQTQSQTQSQSQYAGEGSTATLSPKSFGESDIHAARFGSNHQLPTVIKAVCSSGGVFTRCTGGSAGGWDYEGGETRLVSIPVGCTAEVLFHILERITYSVSESSELPNGFLPILKYRLPSDPTVWVDIIDDEDVALMFDEWAEVCLENSATQISNSSSLGGKFSSRSQTKLHIFVQWRPTTSAGDGRSNDDSLDLGDGDGSTGEGSGGTGFAKNNGNLEQYKGNEEAAAGKKEKENNKDASKDASQNGGAQQQKVTEEIGEGPTSRAGHAERALAARAMRRHNCLRAVVRSERTTSTAVDLAGIIERMEIIDPADVTLNKFLGSGGYGDVYLGRWHACEVAVKCLNPALFFQGSEPGSINRAAVADLIREADILGSLRHPCVVWVYGLVLPRMPNSENGNKGGGTSDDDHNNNKNNNNNAPGADGFDAPKDIVDVIKQEARGASMMPGVLRPPALVTEYMAGGSLKSALARRADIVAGPLTRLVLALDAAKGLEYLHSKKICHFDVKSGNLLLGYRDRRPVCKVADFGLAREKVQTFVSGVTSQRGTLPWTAPEILRSPDAVTEKVDVFSFGIVMWELWTGKEPYEGLNYHALMVQLANPEARLRPPVPGSPEWDGEEATIPPELAPGWRALMEQCWAESPEDRPSFTQIIIELREMIALIKPQRNAGSISHGHGRSATRATSS